MKVNLVQVDKNILNIIKTYQTEYYDKYLEYESRENVFWNLSAIRRKSLEWYRIAKNHNVLIIGDNYGAITGIASEMAGNVDVIVQTEDCLDAIRVRYKSRNNIAVYTSSNDLPERQFDFVIISLDNVVDYDWQNSFVVDTYIDGISDRITDDCMILVLARGEKEYDLERILYNHGFKYQNEIDYASLGFIFIEVCYQPFEKFEIPATIVESNRNELVDCSWVRKNYLPIGGPEVIDQDTNLIEDVKKVEIDLLAELKRVCEANSLQLYPIYGTLLGAMRDGGFIPGDDDVDVAMPRADYNKLIELQEEFTGDYFLQTPYNENCFYGGYLKLRNKSTTAINPQNEFVDICEGIGIDIFPLDTVYSNSFKEKRKKRSIRFLQRLLFAKSYGYFRQFRDMPMLKWKAYKYVGKLFDKKKLVDRLYEKMEEGQHESGKYAIYCHYNGRLDIAKYFNKKDFKKTFSLNYEGQLLDVPAGWNNVLISTYGEGYLEKPGFNEWKQRHGFYDVNVPYQVYKKRFGGLKYPSTISEPIILFGDGSVFKGCLEYYQSRVNIIYLVQLPGESKMESVMGMQVLSWDEFEKLKVPRESYRAVICSGDSRRAESILKDNGFEDYYIFWYNRQWMLHANQSAIWAEIERSK